MAARLDSPPRVEEAAADLDAEEEELLRQTQGRTLAALERCVTERLHGRTAESTARYWAAVREATSRPHGRRRAAPHIVIKRVVGEGGRSVVWIKEDEAAAARAANAARIGEEEDGREASFSANGRVGVAE